VDEIDVVANIAAIKSGDWAYIANDADSMTRLGHMRNLTVKWIIEMNLLTEDEIARMCEIAVDKEVDFVKTSTGTVGGAVTVEDIQLLRRLLPETMQIKASGGIRTREQAIALVEAGANRLGTSVIKPLMA
jgi:deoxyribose-phosphate aldolase